MYVYNQIALKKIDLYSPHNKNSEEDEKEGKTPLQSTRLLCLAI